MLFPASPGSSWHSKQARRIQRASCWPLGRGPWWGCPLKDLCPGRSPSVAALGSAGEGGCWVWPCAFLRWARRAGPGGSWQWGRCWRPGPPVGQDRSGCGRTARGLCSPPPPRGAEPRHSRPAAASGSACGASPERDKDKRSEEPLLRGRDILVPSPRKACPHPQVLLFSPTHSFTGHSTATASTTHPAPHLRNPRGRPQPFSLTPMGPQGRAWAPAPVSPPPAHQLGPPGESQHFPVPHFPAL